MRNIVTFPLVALGDFLLFFGGDRIRAADSERSDSGFMLRALFTLSETLMKQPFIVFQHSRRILHARVHDDQHFL